MDVHTHTHTHTNHVLNTSHDWVCLSKGKCECAWTVVPEEVSQSLYLWLLAFYTVKQSDCLNIRQFGNIECNVHTGLCWRTFVVSSSRSELKKTATSQAVTNNLMRTTEQTTKQFLKVSHVRSITILDLMWLILLVKILISVVLLMSLRYQCWSVYRRTNGLWRHGSKWHIMHQLRQFYSPKTVHPQVYRRFNSGTKLSMNSSSSSLSLLQFFFVR